MSVRSRAASCLFSLAVAAVLFSHAEAKSAIPDPAQLVRAHAQRDSHIRTLRLEARRERTVTFVDANELAKYFGYVPPFPRTEVSVQHRDGRICLEIRDPWNVIDSEVFSILARSYPDLAKGRMSLRDVPFDEVRQAAESALRGLKTPVSPLIFVFDGRKVWKHDANVELETAGTARKVFVVLDPDRRSGPVIPRCLAHQLLIAFPAPAIRKLDAERRRNRLADLLQTGDYKVSTEEQTPDGRPLVVLEAPRERIVLDPSFGYAVRRRLWKYRDGKPVYELTAERYQEVVSGVWLPRKVTLRQYGIADIAGGRYAGRPLFEEHWEVTAVEVNNPEHERYLSVDVPAGVWVVDETRSPAEGSRVGQFAVWLSVGLFFVLASLLLYVKVLKKS